MQRIDIDMFSTFVTACLVETALKLHAPGSVGYLAAMRASEQPNVQEMRETLAFRTHNRCEPNFSLDGGSLACLEKALPYGQLERAKIGFVKVVLCPQNTMLDTLESNYAKETNGASPWGTVTLSPLALLKAIKPMKLDSAMAGMRRSFWEKEARRQGDLEQALPLQLPTNEEKAAESGLWQKTLFVNLFVQLSSSQAFEAALKDFGNVAVWTVLEETLLVNSAFFRMILAREYSLLLKNVPENAGLLCVTVGGGAVRTLRECIGKDVVKGQRCNQKELLDDLVSVHKALVDTLDPELVSVVNPRGWRQDHTEHASCELRRFKDAEERLSKGKQPKRKRDLAHVAERQALRCQRLRSGPPGDECWRVLGFSSLPTMALGLEGLM